MNLLLSLIATLLALAPTMLPAELAAALGRGSRLALCVLPFVTLAGLPSDAARGARAWPLVLAAALPCMALAAWLDARNGIEVGALVGTAAVALVLIPALGEASHLARGRSAHAIAWLALVPGAPAAMAALVWVAGARAGLGVALDWLLRASPVGWALGRVGASSASLSLSAALLPLAAAALLLLLALLPSREEGA